MAPKREFKSVNDYIVAFHKNVQCILKEFRITIREAAPEAEETISYQMPSFKLNCILVWYAA